MSQAAMGEAAGPVPSTGAGGREIQYFYSLASPFAYLGHALFMGIVARHGLRVVHKPVFLSNVFAETGGVPLPKRHPARVRYRLVELQRWSERRGLPLHPRPKFWPFDVNRADRFIIAMVEGGHDPDPFLRKAFAAIWEHEQNLADDEVLVQLAKTVNLPGRRLLDLSHEDATEDRYEQNFRDAVACDVFGSPSYVLDGEVFWGQDRLELLDDALTTGRPAFAPLG